VFNNARRVLLRALDGTRVSRTVELPNSVLEDVGFAAEDGLLPYSDRSFLGYRHLQEYFSFPNKFFFFDLNFSRKRLEEFGDRLEILIELRDFEDKDRLASVARQITPTTFRLACTPAVNLFPRIAEPIRLTQAKTEYRVVPDVRNQATTEVFSIDRVRSMVPTSEEAVEYQPLYSARHATAGEAGKTFWQATRKSDSFEEEEGTEVYISFANLDFQPALPDMETVTLNVTCTNRNLPGKLSYSADWGYLRMESGGPARVRCLAKFTDSIRPPLKRGLQWRLISHLTLNHLSLVGGRPDALQEILRLYDFADQPETRKLIAGITAVSSNSRVGRIASEHGIVFGRGLEVNLEFDEEQYVGVGFFLLATVLERFLSLYNSINSFSELVIRTKQQRSQELKRWPPRAGDQILL
jgi:type VI secretion system protein ImpG